MASQLFQMIMVGKNTFHLLPLQLKYRALAVIQLKVRFCQRVYLPLRRHSHTDSVPGHSFPRIQIHTIHLTYIPAGQAQIPKDRVARISILLGCYILLHLSPEDRKEQE